MFFDLPDRTEKRRPKALRRRQVMNFLGIQRTTLGNYISDGLLQTDFQTEHVLNFALNYRHKLRELKDMDDQQITDRLNNCFFDQSELEKDLWKTDIDMNFLVESFCLFPVYIHKYAEIYNITKRELELLMILRRYNIFNQSFINNLYPGAIAAAENLKGKELIKAIDKSNISFCISRQAEIITQQIIEDIMKRPENIFNKKLNDKQKLINLISSF